MITIISEDKDKSTDKVIEWLIGENIVFSRLNFSTFSNISIELNDLDECLKTEEYTPTKVWFRRGRLQLLPNKIIKSSFNNYLKKEERVLIEFYEKFLKGIIPVIGSYQEENLNNKILNLSIARNCGLKIPNTIVTNCKSKLLSFYKKNKVIISKCIFHPPNFSSDKHIYSSIGTFLVEKKSIDFLNKNFAPALFQKYIKKKYEIRTFFIEDKFYSMAILSQNDIKTKIDFRNYNAEKPNRNIPFKLPCNILSKLKEFIRLKEINSGSVDFIVTPENDFVFLEINPQGQFDWLSENCNYYIHKDIASLLSNN